MYFLHFSLSPSSKVEPGPKEEEKQPQADPERRRASQEELDGGRARRARLGELVAEFFFFFWGGGSSRSRARLRDRMEKNFNASILE